MTLQAEPVTDPPPKSKLPKPLIDLVEQHPEMFPIVTPINVDAFRKLL